MTVSGTPLSLGDGRFAVAGNRWDLLDAVPLTWTPTVSVVVPYYDGQPQLDRMLAALAAQTHPADRLQVIVADDGSPTPPIVRAPADMRVEVVAQHNQGFRAAAARNLGAACADGEVLCFLDQDTWPEPGYVRAVTRLPALLPDALVTGRRRHADLHGYDVGHVAAWVAGPGRGDRPSPDDQAGRGDPEVLRDPQWLLDEHLASGDLLRVGPESYKYMISAVMACSRRLFNDVGGFNPDFLQYGGEDWEFAHRALCAGAVLAHVSDAVAWHDGPSWADRENAQSRRQQQNAETATVIGLIPPAYGRAQVWTLRPNVVVEISIHDEDSAAVVVAVRSVLSVDADVAVWLNGPGAPSVIERHFPFDPRVHADRPGVATSAGARIHVSCSRPLRFAPSALTALIDRLSPYRNGSAAGQLIVDTGDGELVMTSTAAHNRARRWSPEAPTTDLVDFLFGRIVVQRDGSGVTAVPRQPDLAHELKHLRDP